MEIVINNAIDKLSSKYLCKDVSTSISTYINIIDYYDVKYTIRNIQCVSSFKDIITFVSYHFNQILIYNKNVCINTISLIDLDININFLHSIEINDNYIVLGTVYGDVYIINIHDISLQEVNFHECITLIKFIDEEHFILSTMDNKLYLCDVYGNRIFLIDIASYIISFEKIDERTFLTGSIDGLIQYWNFTTEELILVNTHDYYFVNSIHSIVTFNDKLYISYTDSKCIFERQENNEFDYEFDYENVFGCKESIIAMANFNNKYFILLCEDGFIYIYGKSFKLQKKIFVDIYNPFAKIHVCDKKILVQSNGKGKIIYC